MAIQLEDKKYYRAKFRGHALSTTKADDEEKIYYCSILPAGPVLRKTLSYAGYLHVADKYELATFFNITEEYQNVQKAQQES